MLSNTHAASHVVAPLRIGDHVIGALCVGSSQPNHFSDEATDVVTKLANTATVALQNARLYAQAEKVAVLEERNRIAADMHDGLGQTLSYLGLVTDQTAELLAEGEDEMALANLERTRKTINQATHQVRESIRQLMDGASRERKLASLLEETVREFEDRYRVDIRWQVEDNTVTKAPREMTEQILNVARETLENACRHAHAQSICVQLGRENGSGHLTVSDDGCGFDPAAQALQANGHFGLRVMRRARRAHRRRAAVRVDAGRGNQGDAAVSSHGEKRMSRYRVLLVDDHALLREGLAGIISSQPDMEVAGEANDGLEAVVMAQELRPDLVLMDVQMPALDGIEATRQIREKLPETTIVMLTVRDDDEKLLAALKAGAQGYLLKDIHSRDMLALVRGALRGEAALSPRMAGRVLAEFQRMNARVPAYFATGEDELVDLTRRELETLSIVARGASDKEIAEELCVSIHTVKSHMRSILSKLHVNTRREAARVARRRGLL